MNCNLELCPSLYILFIACSPVTSLYAQFLGPPLANSDIYSERRNSKVISPVYRPFHQRGFIPRLNIYHQVCIAIDGILSQPVQIVIQMYLPLLRASTAARLRHRWQKRGTPLRCRAWPKKTCSSFGSVIILIIVRSFRSVNLSHIEFRQSLARPSFASLNLITSYPILCLRSATTILHNDPRTRGFVPSRDNL